MELKQLDGSAAGARGLQTDTTPVPHCHVQLIRLNLKRKLIVCMLCTKKTKQQQKHGDMRKWPRLLGDKWLCYSRTSCHGCPGEESRWFQFCQLQTGIKCRGNLGGGVGGGILPKDEAFRDDEGHPVLWTGATAQHPMDLVPVSSSGPIDPISI